MKRHVPVSTLAIALRLCRRHFLAAGVFSAFVNILYIVPTLYMLQVYDRVIPTQGVQTLIFLTAVLLFGLATLALLDRARSRLLVRAGIQLDATLAPLVLDATIGRPDLPVARQAIRDFDALRATLTGAAILALLDAPWIPIYLLVCFVVHPLIGGLALVGCLLLPLIAWANERGTKTRMELSQSMASASYALQDSLLSSADSVRALGMRRALVARQIRHRRAMLNAQTEASFAGGTYLTLTKFVRLALQSLALGLGALLAIENMISGGAIFVGSFLIARAFAPIEQLVGTWRTTVQARQAYRELSALLDALAGSIEPTRLPAPRGDLSLQGLSVFDPSRETPLLDNIWVDIQAGEVIAIIGPSGAGKSTLVRAIAGALVADRGTVRLDGADIADWDSEELAKHIGYLPQDSALFAGSVAENIARFGAELGGDRDVLDAAIVKAAAAVGADGLIRRLPNGYDHQLALGGKGVSAGQAQRIGLARALFGDPRILILDEPNANLDTEGDAALVTALRRFKEEQRTVLIISHKLGILPVVDKILVLRNGRAEMFGPRDAVLTELSAPSIPRVPANPMAKSA